MKIPQLTRAGLRCFDCRTISSSYVCRSCGNPINPSLVYAHFVSKRGPDGKLFWIDDGFEHLQCGKWHHFLVGDVFKEKCRLISCDPYRMTWERLATGSTETVTQKLVDRCRKVVESGGTLKRRANGPAGISYTVLIEEVVVACLGLHLDEKGEWSK